MADLDNLSADVKLTHTEIRELIASIGAARLGDTVALEALLGRGAQCVSELFEQKPAATLSVYGEVKAGSASPSSRASNSVPSSNVL